MGNRRQNKGPSVVPGQARKRSYFSAKSKITAIILTFLISFLSWVVLSGKFDRFHLSLGIVSCLIVAVLSHDLLFPDLEIQGLMRSWAAFIAYLPWLLYQVFLANIHVMVLVFHPRMMELIDPHVIQFKSRLEKRMSHFIFANSITLTPGTITVYVTQFGEYSVHAIDQASGESLPGDMEAKIRKILEA